MKWMIALISACVLSTAVLAEPGPQRLEQLTAQAKALADKKAYADAATLLEGTAGDIEITTLGSWSDTFYIRARYQALAGQPDKALASLRTAVDVGAAPSSDELAKEADFVAIRERPEFKALIGRLEKEAALWQDNPAIATPYKPVLSEEEKVAGLSKIWSEARFNFPFFGRIPEVDWDATYMAYLPQVRAAQTTEEYYRVLSRFMATLKDGHTRVILPNEIIDRLSAVTAVNTRLIQGKVIITGVTDPTLEATGVRTGAEIIAIDGKPALEYAKTEVEPYVAAFTPQDRARWQYGYMLLRGPIDKAVHLTLKDAKGRTFTTDVPRLHNGWAYGMLANPAVPAEFKILPGNIAYLQVNEFRDDAGLKAFKENFATASAAEGLIIDIRENGGGDDRNGINIVRILADKPFKGSNWRTRDYKAAMRSWNRPIGWFRAGGGEHQPDTEMHYSKPVIVLTGGRTYSAAEDFTAAFLTAGRGKLIGETTGGSTGNPMLFKLPGGGLGIICTKDDSFADGRVFEGVGIAPDIEVKPTIADIRAGRDPVLAKAAAVLTSAH